MSRPLLRRLVVGDLLFLRSTGHVIKDTAQRSAARASGVDERAHGLRRDLLVVDRNVLKSEEVDFLLIAGPTRSINPSVRASTGAPSIFFASPLG
jgi:hypothetical protein